MSVVPGARGAHSRMVRETVIVSAALGFVVAAIAVAAGQAPVGLGVALGLLLGSANAYLIGALLDHGTPFVFASLSRLALLSALAVGAALVIGASFWSVLIGVAAAQFAMVAAGVRQGMRPR